MGQVRVKDGIGELKYLGVCHPPCSFNSWEAEAPRALWGLCGPQLSRHICSLEDTESCGLG